MRVLLALGTMRRDPDGITVRTAYVAPEVRGTDHYLGRIRVAIGQRMFDHMQLDLETDGLVLTLGAGAATAKAVSIPDPRPTKLLESLHDALYYLAQQAGARFTVLGETWLIYADRY